MLYSGPQETDTTSVWGVLARMPWGRGVDASSWEGDLGRLSKHLKPILPDPALVGIYPADVFTQVARSMCTAYSFKPGRN